jgi:hypothetical protein
MVVISIMYLIEAPALNGKGVTKVGICPNAALYNVFHCGLYQDDCPIGRSTPSTSTSTFQIRNTFELLTRS